MDCEKLKNFMNENDRFCRSCGIRLVKVAPGYAEGELEITDHVLNGRDFVQGGAIMTLADFTFAGAANATGRSVVSLSVNTNFLRPARGKKLRAVAQPLHQGRATGVYQVEVFDDNDVRVAAVTVTGFVVGDQPIAG